MEIRANGVDHPVVGKASLEATLHSIDLADASWLISPDAKLPVGKAESRIIIDSTHVGRFMGIPDLLVEAPTRESNDATGGTTESGISSNRGLVFTGTPKTAGFDEKVSIAVDLSIAGPDQTTLVLTATGVLTGAGHRRPAGSRRQEGRGAGGVLHPHARPEAAVRARADRRGRPRLRHHHRGHRRGSNHRPGRVQSVMSSSWVLAITVLVAALGVAYVIGRLLTLRAGLLKASDDAANVDTSDLGLSDTGPTVVHFSAVWCGPCAGVRRVVEQVCDELPEVAHVEIDMDANPEAAQAAFGAVASHHDHLRRRRAAPLPHPRRPQGR